MEETPPLASIGKRVSSLIAVHKEIYNVHKLIQTVLVREK